MADYQRVIRQQALREAEGYLDLAMGFAEQWQVAPLLRRRLAQRALDALERVRGGSGQRAHSLYLTGQAYRVMHRYDEAIAPLAAASELDSENIFIWLALAWCHKRTRRLDLAIEALENAVAVDGREPILHYNLACYWSLAGNPQIGVALSGSVV